MELKDHISCERNHAYSRHLFFAVVLALILFLGFLSVPSGQGIAEPAQQGSSETALEDPTETAGQAHSGSADCVMSADEYENSVTAANMVLLVSFSDTSQDMLDAFNASYYIADNALGIKTNWQNFMWSVDGIKQTYVQRTWRDYLYEISQGQCNTKSYFPQTQVDGKVVHITLDRPASNYKENDGLLVGDIASKFNAQFGSYDASKTDKNGDGFVDNLMIVPTSSGVFTSHKGSLGEVVTFGSGSNARGVKDSITVVEGPLELSNGGMPNSGFSESVAVHEYLHTLGARDYYRNFNGISGDPVSHWDVMASGGVYSWPLAFTRETVGWASIPEVNLNDLKDSYTLYAPAESDAKKGVSNPSKPQALKIKTSLSSSEYFIVEYRQKSTNSFGYDRYIGASGLIVYRVNETHSIMGNIRGDDYVYVFRPGETGLKSSAGDIDRAAIAAGSYVSQNGKTLNTSIGSTDLSAKFTDNTIFFENGLNSGIKIDAVSQTDGSITFKIQTADYAQADMWEALVNKDGSTPFGSWNSPTVQATSDESSPYMLVGCTSPVSPLWAVWKHDGENWQQVGTRQNDLRNVRLATLNGTPYLLGVSTSNQKQLVLKAFASGSWNTVATTTLNGAIWSTDLRVIGGKLYVFGGAEGDCRIFNLEGTTLKQYGSVLSVSSNYQVSLADCGGQPMLVSNDQAVAKTNAYRWTGSSWASTQIKASASSVIKSVTKDGKTYVYTFSNNGSGNSAQLSILSNVGAIERTLALAELQDATSDTSICAGKNNLYFAKSTSTGVKAYSLPFSAVDAGDASQIVQLGGAVFSNASSMDIVALGDTAYCMLGDWSSSSVAVRHHKLLSGDTAAPLDPSQGGSVQPTPISITNANISLASQKYTGAPLMPKPVVKIGQSILAEGVDYTLSYSNNVNVGVAKVIVTGKGNYTGVKEATFSIVDPQGTGPGDTGNTGGTGDTGNTGGNQGSNTGNTGNNSGNTGGSSGGSSGNTSGGTNSGSSSNGSGSNNAGNPGSSAAQTPAKAPTVTGTWKKSGGKWWFAYDSRSKASQKKSWPTNEWVSIKGKKYHFDAKGYMHTNWQRLDGKWRYFAGDGAMRTGWQKAKGTWYYLGSDGVMQTGKKTIGSATYYLNPSSGAMKIGWNNESSGWHYYASSGAMKTGWQKVGGKWYYLNPSNGAMRTGWLDVGGKTYLLRPSSGAMITGWARADGVWYYFNGSGVMQKSKWVGNYYVGSDGAMATNAWIGNYHVNSSGKWDKTR